MKTKILILLFATFLCACSQTPVKDNSSLSHDSGRFSVTPASDLFLNVSLKNGSFEFASVTQGPENANLTFSMSELSSGGIMMSVRSQLKKAIKYDLHMVDDMGRHHYTSSCPLMPGSGAFESWGHSIPEIIVSNFRVLDDDSEIVCE